MVKNLSANVGDERDMGLGSTPGLGRSRGGGHGNPLQYSCLEKTTDRGAWQAMVQDRFRQVQDTTEAAEQAGYKRNTESTMNSLHSFFKKNFGRICVDKDVICKEAKLCTAFPHCSVRSDNKRTGEVQTKVSRDTRTTDETASCIQQRVERKIYHR